VGRDLCYQKRNTVAFEKRTIEKPSVRATGNLCFGQDVLSTVSHAEVIVDQPGKLFGIVAKILVHHRMTLGRRQPMRILGSCHICQGQPLPHSQ